MKNKKIKNKERDFDNIIDDLKLICDNNVKTQNEADIVNELYNEAVFLKQKNKKSEIRILIYFIMILLAMGFIGYQFFDIIKYYENQVREKSIIINELSNNDEVLKSSKNYTINKDDSTLLSAIKYIRKKKFNDSLMLEIKNLQNTVKLLKDTNEINRLKIENQEIKIENENIKYYYDIRIDKYGNIFSPKIDSALRIYKYYNNKLRYDSEQKKWIVTIDRNK